MASQLSLYWILFLQLYEHTNTERKQVASFWVWYARVNLIEVYDVKKFIHKVLFSGYTKSIVKHTNKKFKV